MHKIENKVGRSLTLSLLCMLTMIFLQINETVQSSQGLPHRAQASCEDCAGISRALNRDSCRNHDQSKQNIDSSASKHIRNACRHMLSL